MAGLDVSATRANFPALKQDQVFFDNAGGSQTLGTVIEAIREYLSNTNVQLGASYRVGKSSTSRYSEGKAAGARYINAAVEESVFGSSSTQLYRNVASTLHFEEGDEVVLSGIDHEANIAPWADLAARQKLTVKWWKPKTTANPKLLASDLKELLSPKTRLVACTHASNILGTIHDIASIAEAVHSVPDALLCVDAVAYAPHRPIDVKALGVDLYCFSWYKVYGPHIAMLYASPTAQKHIKSLNHYFNSHDTLEDKIGLAGGSYELLQSVPAILDYLGPSDGEKWKSIVEHEFQLQSTLLEYLNSRPDVTIRGEKSPDPKLRVPTVSFTVDGWNSQELVETVEKDTNFGFRWGAFYSNRLVHEVLGLPKDGVVRVSMVHYNTVEEVKGLIAAIDKVLSAKK